MNVRVYIRSLSNYCLLAQLKKRKSLCDKFIVMLYTVLTSVLDWKALYYITYSSTNIYMYLSVYLVVQQVTSLSLILILELEDDSEQGQTILHFHVLADVVPVIVWDGSFYFQFCFFSQEADGVGSSPLKYDLELARHVLLLACHL